ncbi:MAG: RNase adapter RapZ [Rhodospirillaceae bacterium]|nr:RNase adapter RapZ [Rhodospirillaceae bacterium]
MTDRSKTGSVGTGSAGRADSSGGSPLIVVTGLAGAGLTTALKILEDLGYETVDNLPLALLPGLAAAAGARPLAVGIDCRTRDFAVHELLDGLAAIGAETGAGVRLVYLLALPEALLRRFAATRRRHPLAPDRPVADGIRRERELTEPLRAEADLVIDTTDFAPADLRRVLEGHFAPTAAPGMTISIVSFSYRHGVPREADLVFDVRFLRNPHYDPMLGPLPGTDPAVAAFIAGDPGYDDFSAALDRLILPLLPRYEAEGKAYLTIAIGCTGGWHRSVAVAERLAGVLHRAGRAASLTHRDLGRGLEDRPASNRAAAEPAAPDFSSTAKGATA